MMIQLYVCLHDQLFIGGETEVQLHFTFIIITNLIQSSISNFRLLFWFPVPVVSVHFRLSLSTFGQQIMCNLN